MSWASLPVLEPDGSNWPISVAAELYDIPVEKIRREIKKQGIQPSGVLRMDDFRRSGRHPMAYPASDLIAVAEQLQEVSSPFG